ncbi:MAG: class I SAM-dependent methyltransferase [Planctomycetes bacterium]|nr:class I SAM-dependent methyltransferase [Planctomycetota bacterium]
MAKRYLPDYHPALMARAVELWSTRPDVRAAFPELDSPEFVAWLNISAFLEIPGIREMLPPVPPDERINVVSLGGLGGYLAGGVSAFAAVQRAAHRLRRRIDSFPQVLDFGCGSGRTLRHWLPFVDSVHVAGSDVDREALQWCRAALDFVEIEENDTRPPLRFASERFDLVYSISIFSHLSEQNHFEWLDELARVTKPGGHVVITTHGRRALARIATDPAHCRFVGLEPQQALDALEPFGSEGFAFCRQEGMARPDLYGMTFISEEYARTRWNRALEVLDYESGGVDDWQDVITLVKR